MPASDAELQAAVAAGVAEGDVYGGFAVSFADIRLALRMLKVDGAAARLAERWELLTDPATTSLQHADALGVEPHPLGRHGTRSSGTWSRTS